MFQVGEICIKKVTFNYHMENETLFDELTEYDFRQLINNISNIVSTSTDLTFTSNKRIKFNEQQLNWFQQLLDNLSIALKQYSTIVSIKFSNIEISQSISFSNLFSSLPVCKNLHSISFVNVNLGNNIFVELLNMLSPYVIDEIITENIGIDQSVLDNVKSFLNQKQVSVNFLYYRLKLFQIKEQCFDSNDLNFINSIISQKIKEVTNKLNSQFKDRIDEEIGIGIYQKFELTTIKTSSELPLNKEMLNFIQLWKKINETKHETIPEIMSFIKNNFTKNDFVFIVNILSNIINSKLWKIPEIFEVYNQMSMYFNIKLSYKQLQSICLYLAKYCYWKGIYTSFETGFPLNTIAEQIKLYEQPYQNESIEFIVVSDDLNQLKQMIKTYPDFLKKHPKFNHLHINTASDGNWLDFSAFYGSSHCFFFFLENGIEASSKLGGYASSGGNEEICQYCYERNIQLDYLELINNHHNIILEKYFANSYTIYKYLIAYNAFNFEIVYLFLLNGFALKFPQYTNYSRLIKFGWTDAVKIIYSNFHWISSSDIFYAIKARNDNIIKLFNTKNGHMVSFHYKNHSILQYACKYDNFELVKYLLQNGANVLEKYPKNNKNILHYACQSRNLNLVKYIIKYGGGSLINEHLKSSTGKYKYFTPLFYACYNGSIDIMEYLISCGANINEKCFDLPIIHLAIQMNNLDVIQFLVQNKCEINCEGENKQTTYLLACQTNNESILTFFLKHGISSNTTKNHKQSKNELIIAIENNDFNKVKMFLSQSDEQKVQDLLNTKYKEGEDEYNFTPLHCACKIGSIEIVQYLVARGCNVNVKTSYFRTPLHCACKSFKIDCVKFLVENGANIEAATKDQERPIHFSINFEGTGILEYLIGKGADINVKTNKGSTPLHIAIDMFQDDCSHILMDNPKIQLDQYDQNGFTPFLLAVSMENYPLAIEMMEKGVDIDHQAIKGHNALIYSCQFEMCDFAEMLLEKGAYTEPYLFESYITPLLISIRRDDVDTFKLLMNNGADLNAVTIDNESALFLAVRSSGTEIPKILIEKGLSLNNYSINGNHKNETPLYNAIYYGRLNNVVLLLTNGAQVNWQLVSIDDEGKTDLTDNGFTYLHVACQQKHADLIPILVKYGCDINATSSNQKSPLTIAIYNEDQNSVIELLQLNASFDYDINLLIEKILTLGWFNVLSILLKNGLDPNILIKKDYLITLVAETNNNNLMNSLLNGDVNVNVFNREKNTALHIACINRNYHIITLLLQKGADPHIKNSYHETAFDIAVRKDQEILSLFIKFADFNSADIFSFAASKNAQTLQIFTQKLADANINMEKSHRFNSSLRNDCYKQPIHVACESGSIESVRYLLQKGADIYSTTFDERNALHFACKSGNIELVRFLICCGLTLTQRTFNLTSTLHYAAESNTVVLVKYIMKETGLSIDDENKLGETPLLFAIRSNCQETSKYFLKKGAKHNDKYLIEAIQRKLPLMVNLLLLNDYSPNIRDIQTGDTLLHEACYHYDYQIIESLVKSNADLNSQNNAGMTPLHILAQNGRTKALKLLLRNGANRYIQNNDDLYPFDLSLTSKISKIIQNENKWVEKDDDE